MKRVTLLVCALAALISVTASAADIYKKFPATTKIIVKVDVEQLQKSKLVTGLKQKFMPQVTMFQGMFMMHSGIDFNTIKSGWVISEGKDDGIIILEGDFATGNIESVLAANEQNELIEKAGCQFAALIPDGDKNKAARARAQAKGKDPNKIKLKKNLAVIIDENTVAIGKPDYMEEFLSVLSGKIAGIDKEAIEMTEKNMKEPATIQLLALDLPDQNMRRQQLLSGFMNCAAKLNIDENLAVSSNITMIDNAQAKAVQQILTGLAKLFQLTKKPDRNLVRQIMADEFLNNLKIEVKENKLDISSSVDGALITDAIELNKKN